MVIVRLSDGLGNQMFQYAAAKALAVQNNTNVMFDMSWYEVNKHRGRRLYGLDIFSLDCQKINQVSWSKDFILKHLHFTRNIYRRFAMKRIKNLLAHDDGVLIKESSLRYDPNVAKQANGRSVYLHGYWQSEQYFAHIRDALLQDFRFQPKLQGENLATARKIRQVANPVAIHIRRGDYLGTNFACCTLEYYQKAIDYLAERTGDMQLFVFSNDIPWAKENLKTNQEIHFVDQNSEANGYEDMRLMSLCHHHIIANSSFSWWGAWLGGHEGKIVIAPEKWTSINNEDYRDIIPFGWLKM